MIRTIAVAVAGFALMLTGCASEKKSAPMAGVSGSSHEFAADEKASLKADEFAARAAPEGEAGTKKQERKIIYTSRLQVVTDDFKGAENKLNKLIAALGADGKLDSMTVDSVANRPRHGTWVFRVRPDKSEAFMANLEGLGELQNKSMASDDKTDQYYDLANRIKNETIYRDSLREDLKSPTTKSEERTRIRELIKQSQTEIDNLKGRLNRLDDLVSFSTITLDLFERGAYIPPSNPEFSSQIARTFYSSINGLIEFGKLLVLGIVGLVPWLPVLAVIALLLLFMIRRVRRRTAQKASA